MMRRLMTILLAACLLSGALTFSAFAADEGTGQWQSVEDFEQHALAYWVRPVHGEIQPVTEGSGREFGGGREGERGHAAIDFLLPLIMGDGYGTPIYAMASGTVIHYKPNYYGATDAVAVRHADGSILYYCEISTPLREGDTVTQGEQIGEMIYGYGYCMLHLELYLGTSEGNVGSPSASPDGSSREYYKYVEGHYSRRSDLLDPSFLLGLTRETEPHEHDWDATGLCSVCKCYKEPDNANAPVLAGTYLVKSRTAAITRAYPYAVCAGDGALAAGEQVTVTGAVVNALGETWYRCRYGGQTIYLEPGVLEKTDDPPQSEMPFSDVPDDAFYYDAVLWAVDEGVAAASAPYTEFFPQKNCSRAQAVSFLWRAAGSPEPLGTYNPFDDVSSGSYYYKAVLWAVENGITSGLTPSSFGPDAEVTRAQAMTFLWLASGAPEPVVENTFFEDVSPGGYYYRAVRWAVENEITSGLTPSSFGPDKACTRAQIVSFLHRCAQRETEGII